MSAAMPAARAKKPDRKPASKKPLQKKLAVGAAGDQFEREADQVARGVVHGSDGPAAISSTITSLGAQRTPAPVPRAREREDPRRDSARVQRKPASSVPRMDDEKKSAGKSAVKQAQRQSADGAGAGTVPASVESSIAQMKGGGHGLDGGARSAMESGLGRDFSGVRVHHDGNAAAAAQSLGARAFTVGPDVFFNAGEYRPHTDSGRELIAHELTHTVQQGGAGGQASRQRVQRAKSKGPPKTTPKDEEAKPADPTAADPSKVSSKKYTSKELPGAEVDAAERATPLGKAKGTITLPRLLLPQLPESLKGTAGGPVKPEAAKHRTVPIASEQSNFELSLVQKRTARDAYLVWEAYVGANYGDDIKAQLLKLVGATPDTPKLAQAGAADPVYFLRFKESKAHAFFGTLDQLASSSAMLRPQWSRKGSPLTGKARLQADHFLDDQIGGADIGENMWLLQGAYNESVGSMLTRNIERDLGTVLKEVRKEKPPVDGLPKSIQEMKRLWTLRFTSVEAGGDYAKPPRDFWTAEEIKLGLPLQALRVMSKQEISQAGLQLGKLGVIPREVALYPTAAGGAMRPIKLTAKGELENKKEYLWHHNLFAESGQYQGDATDTSGGTLLTLTIVTNKMEKGKLNPLEGKRAPDVEVPRVPQFGLAGYISPKELMSNFGGMKFGPLSPVTFTDLALSPEGVLMGTGSVLSSKALFPDLDIPLTLYDDTVSMDFAVPVENLSLGPLTVTEAALSLGVNPQGLFIAGSAGFMVTGLGTGMIIASAERREGPRLEGTLDLDTNFLKEAQVDLQYELATDALTAGVNLEVERGRIPGVESGNVRVDISNDVVNVMGTVNLGAPLAGTALTVGYTMEEGLKIAAENVQLPFAKMPAVQNATMSIAAIRRPDGTGWSFGGAGTATLAVPGATGTIDLHYLDGQVTMTALGQVAKGPASGAINFTATNSPVDDQGNPKEGPPSETIRAWGRGSVTVQFGPILRGTAVVELTEKNQIILTGTVTLPAEFPIFDRIPYHREMLRVDPPEFPIWGVSVAGVGVGIFAFVRGDVSFDAYVGAGVIRNAAITAVMDLDHPELATVHGQGEFFVPAYAGLTLAVHGGLRARAAVAFAEGEVGLEGTLGIQADASAALDVDWSPAQGLALETKVAANVRPKFRLDATASVKVGVDLYFTDVSHTFGPWRKPLGEFGPDMELGVSFPVRWSEASGLDINLDQVAIRQPTLDGPALMRGVFDRLTD